MNKKTKRTKQHSNRTKKKIYIGGEFVPSEGVIDIVGEKFLQIGTSSGKYLKDIILKTNGLTEINPVDSPETTNDETTPNILNCATNIASTFFESMNKMLSDPAFKSAVGESAKETAELVFALLQKFNDELSTPEMKTDVKQALDNLGDYIIIVGESMKQPLEVAGERMNEAVTIGLSGATRGFIKVATGAMSAVPGAGAIVSIGKILNDSTASIADMIKAGTNVSSTISQLVVNTNNKIKEKINDLKTKVDPIAPTRIGNATNKIGARIGDVTNKIGARIGDATKKIGTRIGDVTNKIGARIGDATNNIGARIGNSAETGSNIAPTASNINVNPIAPVTPIAPVAEGVENLNTDNKTGGANDPITEDVGILNAAKKIGITIANRTDNSVEAFNNSSKIGGGVNTDANPIIGKGGGRKTKRKFLKRKGKSKRVRFAI